MKRISAIHLETGIVLWREHKRPKVNRSLEVVFKIGNLISSSLSSTMDPGHSPGYSLCLKSDKTKEIY